MAKHQTVTLYDKAHTGRFREGKQVVAFTDCPHCHSEAWLVVSLMQVDSDMQGEFTCIKCGKLFNGVLNLED